MDEQISGIKGQMIQGVIIKKLNIIPDERGRILHMLKKEDKEFNGFGEIYFSSVYPGVIKGWHIHTKMELNYAVIAGNIKLVLYDDRENSETKGHLTEIFTGEDNYLLIKVPPLVWNGFQGFGKKEALIANCSTISHDPQEIRRLDPFSKKIPYEWGLI